MPFAGDFVANCSLLYADRPPLERAAAATADGYRKLEFWWPFDSSVPADSEVTKFVDSVKNSGGQLIAMNFTLGGVDDRGIASHPWRSSEFAAHTEIVASIVAQLGILRCNIPFGVRGSGCSYAEHRRTAVDNLVLASDRLYELGAVPMLEPISGAPDYPIVTVADAVDIIEHVDAAAGRIGALGLLADLYHLAANGEDLESVLHRNVQRIVHVQVADFPGRHEPGTGRLDIDRYLKLLRDWGYRGEVAMEYIPSHLVTE
jgi:hydroxypyruvate isomerase